MKLKLAIGFENIKDQIPHNPGVYRYYDASDQIIYIGKAKNLRHRVGSYFSTKLMSGSKTQALVSNIASMDFIITASEFEAIILEAQLIRDIMPKYNITLKDDKTNLYLVIRKESFDISGKKVNVPKVLLVRKTLILPTDIVFGPYTNSDTARLIYKSTRKIFGFRDCNTLKFNRYKRLKRPCLYGYIGMCLAPCTKNDNASLQTYTTSISKVKKLLSSGAKPIINSLRSAMLASSKNHDYEEAAQIRDTLKKLESIIVDFKTPDRYIENPHLTEDIADKALSELVRVLPNLDKLPQRIECYDIANISGKEAVGAMVTAINGVVDKREYKRFRIKLKNTPDDFAMMREVITRRLKHELTDSKLIAWGRPDLLVIDGGKGQVSAALEVLATLNYFVPVVGLAKKFETLVYKDLVTNEFVEIKVAEANYGLSLLIRLRDEAHRFGQAYHHKLRLRNITNKKFKST